MKIHILSDLPLEFEVFELPEVGADVVVLEGDVDLKHRGLYWAVKTFGEKPVIYVLGNHEFYSGAIPKQIDAIKRLASGTNVSILENTAIEFEFSEQCDPLRNRYRLYCYCF